MTSTKQRLAGVRLALSGAPLVLYRDKREVIERVVPALGGVLQKKLDESSTHLVVGYQGSRKRAERLNAAGAAIQVIEPDELTALFPLKKHEVEELNAGNESDRALLRDLCELAGTVPGGPGLQGARLDRASLGGLRFAQVSLSEARLGGADLSKAAFHEVDLSGADLRGANLSGARFHQGSLARAQLGSANLEGVELSGTSLEGADLTGATLTDVRIYVGGPVDFAGSELGELDYLAQLGALWDPTLRHDVSAALEGLETDGRADGIAVPLEPSPDGVHGDVSLDLDTHTAALSLHGKTAYWRDHRLEPEQLVGWLRHVGARPKLLEATARGAGNRSVKNAKLHELARDAWAALFDVPSISRADLDARGAAWRQEHSRTAKGEADFLRMLERDPDDEETWQVFGDWLQEQGDVRGELITLERGGEAVHRDGTLARFLQEHRQELLGDLTLVEGLEVTRFRHGHPHAVSVAAGSTAKSALQTLASHPLTRVVRELVSHSASRAVQPHLTAAIAARPIVSLTLWGGGRGDLEFLHPCARLRQLHVYGVRTETLEVVRHLPELRTAHFSRSNASSLEPLEGLEQLEVFGIRDCPVSSLEPLKNLSRLRELYLHGLPIGSLQPLAKLSELRVIVLRQCTSLKDVACLATLPRLEKVVLPAALHQPAKSLRSQRPELEVIAS